MENQPSDKCFQSVPRGKAAIVLTTDRNYFLPTFATALSADANCGDGTAIQIFVIGADEAWAKKFNWAIAETKISVKAADIPSLAGLYKFHRLEVVPPITLARFWIGSLLDEGVDRFLYLDGDTMVDGELDSLLAVTPPGDGLMAVPEFIRIYKSELGIAKQRDLSHLRGIECDTESYFNAGVIYVAKNSWRAIASKAMQFLQAHPERCRASDQSALNFAARGKVKFLPLRYNYQSDHMMALDPRALGMKATVWHFVGGPKPWDATGWPWDEYFNRYYRRAEALLTDCDVTPPLPPGAQMQAGLLHRERNRFRMRWVYPWRSYTRRRKILAMMSG